MGLDLKLLPFEAESELLCFSQTVLNMNRNYSLFDEIKKLPAFKVHEKFNSFLSLSKDFCDCGEPHYGRTVEDPYGDWVLFTTAENLLTINLDDYDAGEITLAAWAYLSKLSPSTKVALYWS